MLSFHGLFFGVFFVYFVDLWFEDSHFCLRFEGGEGERENDELDDDCEDEDYDAVVGDDLLEVFEERDDAVFVYPAEYAPA